MGKLLLLLALGLVAILLIKAVVPKGTPPITGADGKVVRGSIAELRQVKLGSDGQWVRIRGRSLQDPILVFFSGGPGGSEMGWFDYFNKDLEDHFVVVIWEQRGAGKSTFAGSRSELRPEQYVSDAIELVEYLCRRFDKEKVILVGHSWGTYIGTKVAQARPDLVQAYVGVGQMIAFRENDSLEYQYALDQARAAGNQEDIDQLLKIGPPPYEKTMRYMTMTQTEGRYSGIEARRAAEPPKVDRSFIRMAVDIPEYSWFDGLKFFLGLYKGMNNVYPHLADVDLRRDVPRLEVPAYFIHGRFDHNAYHTLAEDYYQRLEAPYKELIWFEESGHDPNFREAARFREVLLRVKAGPVTDGSAVSLTSLARE